MKSKALAYPYILWMIIFTVIPILLIVHYSFTVTSGNVTSFTFNNIIRFFDPLYLNILRRSIVLAAQATGICLLLGYPVAYILAQKEFRDRNILIFLFVVPMWMNFLIRTYAWLVILGTNGVLNGVLTFFGFPPIQLLFNNGAVLLGLVYTFLPFMILPIYVSIQKIDNSLVEGAQDLGANGFNVFRRIILPLSLPGVVSGLTMVFMPAVATFVVSNLLGGGQFILIGNLIEQQFLLVGNWNFGSALALILMILIVLCNVLLSFLNKESKEDTL